MSGQLRKALRVNSIWFASVLRRDMANHENSRQSEQQNPTTDPRMVKVAVASP
jgi:hypothetical protein